MGGNYERRRSTSVYRGSRRRSPFSRRDAQLSHGAEQSIAEDGQWEDTQWTTGDPRGTTIGWNYARKSNCFVGVFPLSLLSFSPFLLPSAVNNVAVFSKRLVLAGRAEYGNEETENGKMGAMDNRGTPRNPHRGGITPAKPTFVGVFPLSLFSSSPFLRPPQYPTFRWFRNALYWLVGGI